MKRIVTVLAFAAALGCALCQAAQAQYSEHRVGRNKIVKCYRAFVIVQKNQPPQFVPWETLSRQLGTDYADLKDFKKKGQAALRKIKTLYPGLKIEPATGGFLMHASRLAVPQRSGGKALGS